MRKTKNSSKEGLKDNAKGCAKGSLINEVLLREKLVKFEVFEDRGELKYESRLRNTHN